MFAEVKLALKRARNESGAESSGAGKERDNGAIAAKLEQNLC